MKHWFIQLFFKNFVSSQSYFYKFFKNFFFFQVIKIIFLFYFIVFYKSSKLTVFAWKIDDIYEDKSSDSVFITIMAIKDSSFDYQILLIITIIAALLVGTLTLIARYLSSNPALFKEQRSLTSSYECGFEPFENFSFSSLFLFYRLAIFFIIFEAELIFIYPWAVSLLSQIGWADHSFFYAPMPFIFLLFYGFIVEIEGEALEML